MSKKKKHKNRKKKKRAIPNHPEEFVWQDDNGQVHSLMPGSPPTAEKLEEMTKVYQENIRNSPLWKMMVKQFGKEMAEELLKQCRVEVR